MARENLTEIICIVDRSGSMGSVYTDAIGGFNSFLEDQKNQKGEANFTLSLFDTDYDMKYDCVDIDKVPLLDSESYRLGGMTALHDAIGRTIKSVGDRLAVTSEKDRPGKIIVAILTDGYENSSTDYDKKSIDALITHQREKYSWEFMFLAANQDALAEAVKIGIPKDWAFNFEATAKGVRSAYVDMSATVSCYRAGGK